MFRKHGLPVEIFDYIVWRESRCSAKAISKPNRDGSRDYGLSQVNGSWRSLTARTCKRPANQIAKSLTDPSCNLKVASVLWADGKGASNWRVTSGQ